jgi:hypothetical protein
VSPKLKSIVARIILVAGVAWVLSIATAHVPREHTLAIRLGNREITRVEDSVTLVGDDEPTAGFSRVFPQKSPRVVRHTFKAPTGTYTVVISFEEHTAGDVGPNLTETTFERRVSLVGGEVIVSPD